jgi:hypothetical protein
LQLIAQHHPGHDDAVGIDGLECGEGEEQPEQASPTLVGPDEGPDAGHKGAQLHHG